MPGNDSAPLLAAAHQALKGTVGSFVWQERRYVAKRLAAKPPLPGQDWLVAWFSRRLAGTGPRPVQQAPGPDYELRRLQSLAAAGVRVPPVLAHDGELMVLAHCGKDGFSTMRHLERPARTAFLLEQATLLADFHAAGHWHGGAQIKNVLVQEGQTWRIDFEESFGEALPLPLAQAYDLVLFLNVLPLAGPIDADEARQLLPALLSAYFERHPDPAVRQCLVRLLPWARTLRRLARPFRALSGKSIRRAEILIDCLEAWLAAHP